MHSGNVGHAQDLDSLVRAATFLRDREDIRIVIAGFGARHAEMVELAARLDVEDMVRFLPYQERRPASVLALERRRPRRRAREGARGLRRPEPAVRDPLGGPSGDRRGRRRERDGAARARGRVRHRHPARPPGAARTDDPRGRRGRARPGRDGPARARVRRARGRPRRRHGALPRARPGASEAAGRPSRSRRRSPVVLSCAAALGSLASAALRPQVVGGGSSAAPTIARVIGRAVFWGSLGALAWTHAGYPAAMGVLARVRPRPVARGRRRRPPSRSSSPRTTRRRSSAAASRTCSSSTTRPSSSRSSSPRTARRTDGRDRRGDRGARAASAPPSLPARGQGRGAAPLGAGDLE